jgi:hypothetical protein
MCVIECDSVEVNDDGTVSIWCYCGWNETRPTMDAADAAGRVHMEEFEESERLYRENPAAWVERYG